MTIKRAVNLLDNMNEEELICAAAYIQNQCWRKDEARVEVHLLRINNPGTFSPLSAWRSFSSFEEAESLDVDICQLIKSSWFQVQMENGARKLVRLLKIDNEEVQRAAAGALRNVVYKNGDNKKDVTDEDGLTVILKLLNETHDKETVCQLAGQVFRYLLFSPPGIVYHHMSLAYRSLVESVFR